MAYTAFVTNIKNLHKHPNADRLQVGECFGNEVIVSMEYVDNQVGVYFPTGGQLSVEFADKNNLVRKKDEAGNNIGGYMDPEKRNVTAIKLRGEKSDGLFLPLSCLSYFGDISSLNIGDRIDVFNGVEICKKYLPKVQHAQRNSDGNKTRKKKVNIAPLFAEHADTEQLAYNLDIFRPGDEIEITLKMHGTSQRTACLPVLTKYKRTFMDILRRKEGKPVYEWGNVSGTRRTVLENYDGGYYGSNEFREHHSKFFEGKLWKGESIYYEVVGFTNNGTPIMPTGDNRKLNDKEFVKKYGDTTVFSYGCDPDGDLKNDIYVYRMTMTNEDGDVVEYTPDFMRYRCEQMGVKTVPVLYRGFVPKSLSKANIGEWIKNKAEEYYDGVDPIGKTHIREGVVVRILNRPKFTAVKHKNWFFKALSGIAVDSMKTEGVDSDILSEV